MKEIKFRGRDLSGKYRFGFYAESGDVPYIIENCTWHEVEPESVAQLIGKDGNGDEIYDGDFLQCDLDGLKAAVGNGLMACDIKNTRPPGDAVLRIKFIHDDYYLIWSQKNGGGDTGLIWRDVLAYIKFFTVIEERST